MFASNPIHGSQAEALTQANSNNPIIPQYSKRNRLSLTSHPIHVVVQCTWMMSCLVKK
jgi:hypothetical protein